MPQTMLANTPRRSAWVIGAAHRSGATGPWRPVDTYGVVLAKTPREALRAFIDGHPRFPAVRSFPQWSFDHRGQRVWTVMPLSGVHDPEVWFTASAEVNSVETTDCGPARFVRRFR